MKRYLVSMAICLAVTSGSVTWGSTPREDAAGRMQNSADVLKQIAAAPDKGIPDEVVKRAKCIVVFPHIVKAGLIVGGKYGRGVAVCRTSAKKNAGWSAPAFITIGGGSWGLQIGAEGLDVVMMVMNDKGLQRLLSNKFQITIEGSAAAGPVGNHASVGAGWNQDTEILTYGRSKGAFAGQTLEGAAVEQDADTTTAVYGSSIPFGKILGGSVAAPASAAPFLHAVAEISHEASAQAAQQQAPRK
jgi:SH3 domain-containing YSC84-like protein 1